MDLRDVAARLTVDEIAALLENQTLLTARINQQQHLLDWLKRQLFGARSERRILGTLPRDEQLLLEAEMLPTPEEPPKPGTTVKAYERKQRRNPVEFVASDSRLRFDKTVPVEVINVPNPELQGVPESDFKVISEKVTYRLAQRSPYVVLKYVQPVVKFVTGELVRASAPPAILERSFADVSFLAGMVVDKFQGHLPLYRQHQRLQVAGVAIHRSTMTRLVHRVGELLEPIYHALTSSILLSNVLTMDESPTPAGVKPGKEGKPGKIMKGWFWAMYGDKDEVVFIFSPTRAHNVLDTVLDGFSGKLLADGYGAYDAYAKKTGAVLGQCWTHTRRNFIEAEKFEPEKVATVIELMQQLYVVEDETDGSLEQRERMRQERSLPVVDQLFASFKEELKRTALLPSNPFIKAIEYAVVRETELRVFLNDPAMPMDTNHIERQFRPAAVGRKNWMFHVTEIGARYAGIFYSLIQSCTLAGVNASVYLTDVLQRIDRHPAAEVHLLTPRLWRENFADQPLRSDVYKTY